MSTQINQKLIDFVKTLGSNFRELEKTLNDEMEGISLSEDSVKVKVKFKKLGELTSEQIVEKMSGQPNEVEEEEEEEVKEEIKEPVSDNSDNSEITSEGVAQKPDYQADEKDGNEQQNGGFNFSDTSSINGSFLQGRMNKNLRKSMTGGGMNSDTLASITELQANSMPRYNSQAGGGKMSKAEFLRKMKDEGITSSTSEFC